MVDPTRVVHFQMVERELEKTKRQLAEARRVLADAVGGLRYIEQQHGRLYGVGWDRVYDAAAAALAKEDGNA